VSQPSQDYTVLASTNVTVAQLIDEMRTGLHEHAPLREQIPRILKLADQYDLVGMHAEATRFRQQADALVPLSRLRDDQDAREAERRERARRWRHVLSLGIAGRRRETP
jgi:hypothetical protein